MVEVPPSSSASLSSSLPASPRSSSRTVTVAELPRTATVANSLAFRQHVRFGVVGQFRGLSQALVAIGNDAIN